MAKTRRSMENLHVTGAGQSDPTEVRLRELDRQQAMLHDLIGALRETVAVLSKQVDLLSDQVGEFSQIRQEFDALRKRIAGIGDVLTELDPDR